MAHAFSFFADTYDTERIQISPCFIATAGARKRAMSRAT